MIFKVEVNNTHVPRLAKALGYNGDAAGVKDFIEHYIVTEFRAVVWDKIVEEQKALIDSNTLLPDTDIQPAV